MMIVSAVPLYNIFSVVILTFGASDAEHGRPAAAISESVYQHVGQKSDHHRYFGRLYFCLFQNPDSLYSTEGHQHIAATASPSALLVVGATFEGRKALAKIKPSLMATLIKLVIIPAIFFPFAILFGFRNSELVAILVMLGSPTTVSCYIMAKNMNNDAVLTSSIVVLATLLSSISLTAWIFILRSLALI